MNENDIVKHIKYKFPNLRVTLRKFNYDRTCELGVRNEKQNKAMAYTIYGTRATKFKNKLVWHPPSYECDECECGKKLPGMFIEERVPVEFEEIGILKSQNTQKALDEVVLNIKNNIARRL